MKRSTITLGIFALALALAGCGSEDVENTPIDDIDEIVDEDEPYPVGGELDETQQENYDALDRQAVSNEYDANRDAMMAGSGGSTSGDDAGMGNDSDDDMSGSMDSDRANDASSGSGSMDDGAMTAGGSTSGQTIINRSAMTFDYLDRDGDGNLSVAEYAIWAVEIDPTEPEPNDARPPYLTTDEINTAGETFFYFDDDGDSYLSAEEFEQARESGRTP
ncbi:hypothetical protein [Erythrobacter sp.]|uniref:hypothetical protein n=1 Tax=Erythrobacter sp. TaxID=1042 RepID=UPI003C7846FC